MNKANFIVDTDKCVACGKCVKVCPGGVLFLNHSKRLKLWISKNSGGTDAGNVNIVLRSVRRALFPFLGTNRRTACPLPTVQQLRR